MVEKDKREMLRPFLTEWDDEVEGSEGTTDPLGMAAIAEGLAKQLVPGVTERQKHPRYLTAIAVSLEICREICRDFDEDRGAKDDDSSEPWQVFEWYMVEGLVRSIRSKEERKERLSKMPGLRKVEKAVREGLPLSARNYLKNASSNGFHGIYRILAEELGVDGNGQLGEFGNRLLNVWIKEQGLEGFHGSLDGPGKERREMIHDAVKDGREKGCVARTSKQWEGWEFFEKHLAPNKVRRKEAETIWNALLNCDHGFRGHVLNFLVSNEGKSIWKEPWSEREFHAALADKSDGRMKSLLEAIMTYEEFARLLQDAFDDCLSMMAKKGGAVDLDELSKEKAVETAASSVASRSDQLVECLRDFGETPRFQERFQSLAEPVSAKDWCARLMEHHKKIQQSKPPNGKLPWVVGSEDGSYRISASRYVPESGGRHDQEYVHRYRTGPLHSFAYDLGKVQ